MLASITWFLALLLEDFPWCQVRLDLLLHLCLLWQLRQQPRQMLHPQLLLGLQGQPALCHQRLLLQLPPQPSQLLPPSPTSRALPAPPCKVLPHEGLALNHISGTCCFYELQLVEHQRTTSFEQRQPEPE